MAKVLNLLFVLFLMLFPGLAYSSEPKEYVSPNGDYKAYVKLINNFSGLGYESGVTIKGKEGQILFTRSYSSEIGKSGMFVVKAAWTPDSKFFVYSMSKKGNWDFPTYYFSIEKLKIYKLDDHYGPIVYPDFKLEHPDIIKYVAQNTTIKDELPIEESLSDLSK